MLVGLASVLAASAVPGQLPAGLRLGWQLVVLGRLGGQRLAVLGSERLLGFVHLGFGYSTLDYRTVMNFEKKC